MAFELFDSYGAGARNEATLRASGYLFLSKSMIQAIHADKEKFLVLMYDREENKLGVRVPTPNDPESARREVSIEKSGIAINIVPVLKSYGLEKPKKKARLPVAIAQQMIIVEMGKLTDQIPF